MPSTPAPNLPPKRRRLASAALGLIAVAAPHARALADPGAPAPETEARIRFTQSGYSVAENANALLVRLERIGDTSRTVAIDLSTATGSATAGSDYESTVQRVEWLAEDGGPKLVPIRIFDDLVVEPDETFTLTLSEPDGVVLGEPSEAVVTIVENDDLGVAGPCESSPTTLCLNSDRFQVTAKWRTSTASGDGMARGLTADSGFFTFFDPDNAEVVVKVLDACALFTRGYWVFISGLTDLGVEITVEDVITGETEVFENPLGRDFELIKELSLFQESC